MPELPEITIYLEALGPRIVGRPLERVRITSPSLLRTVDPPLAAAEGRTVVGLRRIGKRIVWELEGGLFFAFHLMVAGRFKWRPEGTHAPAKVGLSGSVSGTLPLATIQRPAARCHPVSPSRKSCATKAANRAASTGIDARMVQAWRSRPSGANGAATDADASCH